MERVLWFKLGGIGDAIDSAVMLGGLRVKHPDAKITAICRDASQVPLIRAVYRQDTGQRVCDVCRPIPVRSHRFLWHKFKFQLDWNAAWDSELWQANWDYAYDARPYIGKVYQVKAGKPSVIFNIYSDDEMTYQNPCSVWTHTLAERDLTTIELMNQSMRIEADWNDVSIRSPALPLPRGDYVVLSNAADGKRRQTKQWSDQRFSNVAQWLKDKGFIPVQLGMKYDKLIPNCEDWRGKTTLLEAVTIVRNARLLVGIEGGLARIAGLVKTPSVVLFLSTPETLFRVPKSYPVIQYGCPLEHGCFWLAGEWMYECQKQAHVSISKEKPLPFCAAYMTVPDVIEKIKEALDDSDLCNDEKQKGDNKPLSGVSTL